MAAPPLPLTVEAAPGRPQTNADTALPTTFPPRFNRQSPHPPLSLLDAPLLPPFSSAIPRPGQHTRARKEGQTRELTLQPCSSSHRCCPVRKLEAFPKERGPERGFLVFRPWCFQVRGSAFACFGSPRDLLTCLPRLVFVSNARGRNLLPLIGTPLVRTSANETTCLFPPDQPRKARSR